VTAGVISCPAAHRRCGNHAAWSRLGEGASAGLRGTIWFDEAVLEQNIRGLRNPPGVFHAGSARSPGGPASQSRALGSARSGREAWRRLAVTPRCGGVGEQGDVEQFGLARAAASAPEISPLHSGLSIPSLQRATAGGADNHHRQQRDSAWAVFNQAAGQLLRPHDPMSRP